MPWNPEVYTQYKDIRFKPFYDLLDLLDEDGLEEGIDLGCGTGEQTATITHRFKDVKILGIDSSAEMLAKSKAYENSRLSFQLANIEEVVSMGKKWDLIFSNAALQWIDNHEELFPSLIKLLKPNGQFAIQMPVQTDNVLNQILLKLVQEEPYVSQLKHFVRESPVLSMDDYAQILFDSGLADIEIYQKVYPIIASNSEDLYNFIAGSALIPYMERLEGEEQERFVQEYKARIAKHYSKFPAIYAFKRILLYGKLKS